MFWRLFLSWAALSLTAFTPQVARADSTSGEDRYAACAGPTTNLAYSLPSGDFLELSGDQRNLVFGNWVRVCLFPDHVEVSGPFVAPIDCDDLLNPTDGGVGYNFTDVEGVPVELWFFVDPAGTDPVLEIGVERAYTPSYWIDTQWPICGG